VRIPEPGPLSLLIWTVADQRERVPAGLPSDGPVLARAIARRALNEVHRCLLCGGCAQAAVVARPWGRPELPRWVDLCARCFHAVRAEAVAAEQG
jgi:hypothetical protein